jgi:gamma-tubulin complex component 5
MQIYRVEYLLQRVRPNRADRAALSLSRLQYKLQHRLTWFTNTLRSYLTETAIFFTKRDMNAAMENAEDIDEMSQIHIKYTAKLRERALLGNDLKPIYKSIINILDLGVWFSETIDAATNGSLRPNGPRKSVVRRKSSVPLLLDDNQVSDDDDEDEDGEAFGSARKSASRRQKPGEVLKLVDREFGRLLPFVAAGLRSVGRVGAEPMWEQLADRLEWEGKKDRVR